LYAGIGGNRKLWSGNIEVTAVEYDKNIADVYQELYPDDIVIVGDAHEYLLKHHKEYNFIWASPPCPTHSDIRRCGVHRGQYKELYPDMKLYEEIILLKHFSNKNTKWVIENVKPYYEYLIKPNLILGRHPFWCNFEIKEKDFFDERKHGNITSYNEVYGFNIKDTKIKDKRKTLRNCVNPEIGLYIFQEAFRIKKEIKQLGLFGG
jgi:DNA (cytosine-5)-methyltransferase 1